MKILLTGATGYVGARLLQVLVESGHTVIALVRSAQRFSLLPHLQEQVQVIEGDLLQQVKLPPITEDIDAAYYLVHSMGAQSAGFASLEAQCAENFCRALEATSAKQVIYLSGLSKETHRSEHMGSRQEVDNILRKGSTPVTTFRTGIVIGSGSASFEIMRDLVEKLPIMTTPRWVESRCQPIAISDVLFYLEAVLLHPECLGKSFDIGGPDILSYKQMLLRLAKVRGLRRLIIPVPVLTPKLSSWWLFFITSTNFSIAQALINSLKMDAVCEEQSIDTIIPHSCLSYEESIQRAFQRIEQNAVLSSWKEAMVKSSLSPDLQEYITVPSIACFKEVHRMNISAPREKILDRLWSIGGKNGWYYMNWAWRLRGLLDRLVGGVGLRRGRRDPRKLKNGDALDFWRVVHADRAKGHLLLYAEMRLPGEAWLEWKIKEQEGVTQLEQIATFRPKGVLGRLYWYAVIPFHLFLFSGLCQSLDPNCHPNPG